MPNYRYRAKMSDGQLAAGVIAADSIGAASKQVRGTGGYILDLNEVKERSAKANSVLSFTLRTGVSTKEILDFSSQMSVMSKAGIGISDALGSISEQVENPRMADIVSTLKRDIESGKQFSQCLERFPKAFSKLYVNMVRASELSGSFAHMLERITGHISRQLE
ncbi:MAG: type II secretion system F family protein, partial [Phycisphaerae bacterium]|nr:type II secretion system F family protein [Phycisphaerae bacterium]